MKSMTFCSYTLYYFFLIPERELDIHNEKENSIKTSGTSDMKEILGK